MKRMKIIYIIAMMAVLSSCSKSFLDVQDPNRVTTDNFWKTEADLKSALAPCYWAFSTQYGIYGGWGFFQQKEFVSEIYTTYDTWLLSSYSFVDIRSEDYLDRFWGWIYWGIGFSNQVIENGGAMDIDTNIKNAYVAEAKFTRGLYYLALVNGWGEVPLQITVAQTKESYPIAKSSIPDVWKQVEQDFNDAIAGLPETRPAADAGRATKGAALAFLGRAQLYQGKWAEAQATLEQITGSNASTYGYDLQANYAELFDGNHKNGVESVFEQQLNGTGGTDVWADLGDGEAMSTVRAMTNGPWEIGGWREMNPTQALLDSFKVEPTIDGKIDPRAEVTMAWDHLDDPNYTFYQKNYHETFGSQLLCKKFQNWELTTEDGFSLKACYPMRYADVLLMLAEAYAMQDNVAAAAPLVKRIRDRANLKDIDFSNWSGSQMMGEIRRQRLLEFAEEGLYFYDLRRWGLLEYKILHSDNPNIERYNLNRAQTLYFPIPQQELNANPLLEQNEAWK